MPRVYKRKPGSRNYKNWSDESMEAALTELRAKKISIRCASEKYGIHWLKMQEKHVGGHGGRPVFTEEEEDLFVAHTVAMSTYGFPMTSFDLRCVVKSYLDRVGRNVKTFKNNFPGIDWANGFIHRHKVLTQRTARNISHARAATDEGIVNDFFDHFEAEIEGVPPDKIWNYDETNLVDDPGSKRIITKRGTKYPEKIRNSSKACTSLMVCGNAAGQLAPLYVNYKSSKLWSTWTENGSKDARYNRTKSGWFDYQSFEDWFVALLLPILKKQIGRKVIIGDNLSSHLNLEVIRLCEENNIRFVALPPNTTHILQPLDVAFFRPMKGMWRKILDEWKETASGSRYTSVPKDEFPRLLKTLMENLAERSADNLKASFKKTGIYPLNRDEVLNRLPNRIMLNESVAIQEAVGNSFISHLQEKREEATQRKRPRKKKRLNVPPGKGITANDLSNGHSGSENNLGVNVNVTNPEPSTSGSRNKRSSKCNVSCDSDDSEEIVFAEADDSLECEGSSSSSSSPEPKDNLQTPAFTGTGNREEISVGDYVIVTFEQQYYPGVVKEMGSDFVLVSAMQRVGANSKWPQKKDEIWYYKEDIITKINKPIQRSRREIFDVPELA